MADLSDLDTAFPRPDSEQGFVVFDNGFEYRFQTNWDRASFEAEWRGKPVKLCLYREDQFTQTSTVAEIRWITPTHAVA